MTINKVILAYSGGLDTSVCVRYLQKLNNLDVVTLTVDCGQDEDFANLEQKAISLGAVKHIHIDEKKNSLQVTFHHQYEQMDSIRESHLLQLH